MQYYSKIILHYKDHVQNSWQIIKRVFGKVEFVNIHSENMLFSIIGISLIKKPLPIASMNILSMLDRN